MKIVLSDKKTYLIGFSHSVLPYSIGFSDRQTQCFIHELNDKNEKILLYADCAICSIKDQFNKNVGRKISLQRCLSMSCFSKEDRTQIWNSYKDMRNGKW
jgi:hypothetical protein